MKDFGTDRKSDVWAFLTARLFCIITHHRLVQVPLAAIKGDLAHETLGARFDCNTSRFSLYGSKSQSDGLLSSTWLREWCPKPFQQGRNKLPQNPILNARRNQRRLEKVD